MQAEELRLRRTVEGQQLHAKVQQLQAELKDRDVLLQVRERVCARGVSRERTAKSNVSDGRGGGDEWVQEARRACTPCNADASHLLLQVAIFQIRFVPPYVHSCSHCEGSFKARARSLVGAPHRRGSHNWREGTSPATQHAMLRCPSASYRTLRRH